MNSYYGFCSSIHYFFEKKMKLADPAIFSISFISFVEMIYSIGLFYVACIFSDKIFTYSPYAAIGIFLFCVALNYFFVYKREKHYSKKLHPVFVISIIVLGYVIIGVSGNIVRDMKSDHSREIKVSRQQQESMPDELNRNFKKRKRIRGHDHGRLM